MKLQNKKTGDIGVLNVSNNKYYVIAYGLPLCGNSVLGEYDTLDALMQEWQDYKEPKKHYVIKEFGRVYGLFDTEISCDSTLSDYREIGNYFETKEEAEKAVEKLKAWQRLKDKGAMFKGWFWDKNYGTCIIVGDSECNYVDDTDEQNKKDLDLLFGGEE